MNRMRSRSLLFLVIVSMTTLACRFSLELPWNVPAPDVAISQEDVSAAATRAAIAAATAASVANQAGQIAATAVAGEGLADLGSAVGAAGSLQEKLNGITPGPDGRFTITFTDADVAEVIASQGSAFSSGDARVENVRVSFLAQHVLVTGDLTSPVSLPLTVELRPVVVNGQLVFQVINANAGVFPVPSSLLSTLEAGVNTGLGQIMNRLPAGIGLLDVALGNGSMTVLGQQQ